MIPTIVIAIAIVLVFLFAKKQKAATPKSSPIKKSSPYRSVAVCCDEFACDGAKALSGKRFLISDTPLLPLLDCTAKKCDCKYSHHPDRRHFDEDRRLPSSLKSSLFSDSGTTERRIKEGRRGGD